MNEIFLSVLDALTSALPLIIAALVPPVIAKFNEYAGEYVPKYLYPIVLPVLGAVLAGIAKAGGVDIGDFNPETANLNLWQTIVGGALVGHASIGVHQIKKQLEEKNA